MPSLRMMSDGWISMEMLDPFCSQQPLWMGPGLGQSQRTGLSPASGWALVRMEHVPSVIGSSTQQPGCYCHPAIFSEQAMLSSLVIINFL